MERKLIQTGSDLVHLSKSSDNKKINFSEIKDISFHSRNISRSILSGNMSKRHRLNKTNIIQSAIIKLNARNVSFRNSDIKDSKIDYSKFIACNFNDAAHINNTFNNCKFDNCTFSQTSITYSEFENVTFTNCNFTHVVISDSRFTKCRFIRCKTSNKLMESSLIFDCSFSRIELEPEIVVENFGLEKKQLLNCTFRIRSENKKVVKVSTHSSEIPLENYIISPIEQFRWSYFQQPLILTNGDETVDKTFEEDSWFVISKNANRFRLLIEKYHEFLSYQFEHNDIPFWNLLKLHLMTGNLSQKIDPVKFVDASRALLGVHVSLARLVEPYIALTANLTDQYINDKKISLLVNGPLEKEYYENELAEVISGTSLKINQVIKHNSPNELYIIYDQIKDLMPFIALVLALKGNISLKKLINIQSDNIEVKKLLTTNHTLPETNSAIELITAEFGFDNKVSTYAFKLQALLPGEHLFMLHLHLRTFMLGKIKKIIRDFLPVSIPKGGNNP